MALIIGLGREKLLYLSDTAMHPVHIQHPDWLSAFDLDPELTVASRLKANEWAIAEQALVLAHHFPYPGIGHIVNVGNSAKWRPIP